MAIREVFELFLNTTDFKQNIDKMQKAFLAFEKEITSGDIKFNVDTSRVSKNITALQEQIKNLGTSLKIKVNPDDVTGSIDKALKVAQAKLAKHPIEILTKIKAASLDSNRNPDKLLIGKALKEFGAHLDKPLLDHIEQLATAREQYGAINAALELFGNKAHAQNKKFEALTAKVKELGSASKTVKGLTDQIGLLNKQLELTTGFNFEGIHESVLKAFDSLAAAERAKADLEKAGKSTTTADKNIVKSRKNLVDSLKYNEQLLKDHVTTAGQASEAVLETSKRVITRLINDQGEVVRTATETVQDFSKIAKDNLDKSKDLLTKDFGKLPANNVLSKKSLEENVVLQEKFNDKVKETIDAQQQLARLKQQRDTTKDTVDTEVDDQKASLALEEQITAADEKQKQLFAEANALKEKSLALDKQITTEQSAQLKLAAGRESIARDDVRRAEQRQTKLAQLRSKSEDLPELPKTEEVKKGIKELEDMQLAHQQKSQDVLDKFNDLTEAKNAQSNAVVLQERKDALKAAQTAESESQRAFDNNQKKLFGKINVIAEQANRDFIKIQKAAAEDVTNANESAARLRQSADSQRIVVSNLKQRKAAQDTIRLNEEVLHALESVAARREQDAIALQDRLVAIEQAGTLKRVQAGNLQATPSTVKLTDNLENLTKDLESQLPVFQNIIKRRLALQKEGADAAIRLQQSVTVEEKKLATEAIEANSAAQQSADQDLIQLKRGLSQESLDILTNETKILTEESKKRNSESSKTLKQGSKERLAIQKTAHSQLLEVAERESIAETELQEIQSSKERALERLKVLSAKKASRQKIEIAEREVEAIIELEKAKQKQLDIITNRRRRLRVIQASPSAPGAREDLDAGNRTFRSVEQRAQASSSAIGRLATKATADANKFLQSTSFFGDILKGFEKNLGQSIGSVIKFQIAWRITGGIIAALVAPLIQGTQIIKEGLGFLTEVQVKATEIKEVLLQNVEFSKNQAENFELATKASEQVLQNQLLLAAQLGISQEKFQQVFESLIQTAGVIQGVGGDFEKANKAVGLLVAGLASVGVSTNDTRRATREINLLLEGRVKTADKIRIASGLSADALNTRIAKAKEEGRLAEELEIIFAAQAERIKTADERVSTLLGQIKLLQQQISGEGVRDLFVRIQGLLKALKDFLSNPEVQKVLIAFTKTFASVADSLINIVASLLKGLGLTGKTTDGFKELLFVFGLINETVASIVNGIALIINSVRRVSSFLVDVFIDPKRAAKEFLDGVVDDFAKFFAQVENSGKNLNDILFPEEGTSESKIKGIRGLRTGTVEEDKKKAKEALRELLSLYKTELDKIKAITEESVSVIDLLVKERVISEKEGTNEIIAQFRRQEEAINKLEEVFKKRLKGISGLTGSQVRRAQSQIERASQNQILQENKARRQRLIEQAQLEFSLFEAQNKTRLKVQQDALETLRNEFQADVNDRIKLQSDLVKFEQNLAKAQLEFELDELDARAVAAGSNAKELQEIASKVAETQSKFDLEEASRRRALRAAERQELLEREQLLLRDLERQRASVEFSTKLLPEFLTSAGARLRAQQRLAQANLAVALANERVARAEIERKKEIQPNLALIATEAAKSRELAEARLNQVRSNEEIQKSVGATGVAFREAQAEFDKAITAALEATASSPVKAVNAQIDSVQKKINQLKVSKEKLIKKDKTKDPSLTTINAQLENSIVLLKDLEARKKAIIEEAPEAQRAPIGQGVVGDLQTDVENLADKITKVKDQISNLRTALNKGLEADLPVTKKFRDLTKTINDSSERIEVLKKELSKFESPILDILTPGFLKKEGVGTQEQIRLQKELAQLESKRAIALQHRASLTSKETEVARKAITAVDASLEKLEEQAGKTRSELLEAEEQASEAPDVALTALKTARDRLEELSKAFAENRDALSLKGLQAAYLGVASQVASLQAQREEASETSKQLLDEDIAKWEDLKQAIREAQLEVAKTDQAEKRGKLSRFVDRLVGRDRSRDITDPNFIKEQISDTIERLNKAIQEQVGAREKGEKTDKLDAIIEVLGINLTQLNDDFEESQKPIEKFKRGLFDLAGVINNIGSGILDTFNAFIEQGAAAGIGSILQVASRFDPTGITAAISTVYNTITGIFTALARRLAEQIKKSVDKILKDLDRGLTGLGDAIVELEQKRVEAIRKLSGKKGGKKELEELLPGLEDEIFNLRKRQKEIQESFRDSLTALRIGSDVFREFADQLKQMDEKVKEFLGSFPTNVPSADIPALQARLAQAQATRQGILDLMDQANFRPGEAFDVTAGNDLRDALQRVEKEIEDINGALNQGNEALKAQAEAAEFISLTLKKLRDDLLEELADAERQAIDMALELNKLMKDRVELIEDMTEAQKEFNNEVFKLMNEDAIERRQSRAVEIGNKIAQLRKEFNEAQAERKQRLSDLNAEIILKQRAVEKAKQLFNLAQSETALRARQNELDEQSLDRQILKWREIRDLINGIQRNADGSFSISPELQARLNPGSNTSGAGGSTSPDNNSLVTQIERSFSTAVTGFNSTQTSLRTAILELPEKVANALVMATTVQRTTRLGPMKQGAAIDVGGIEINVTAPTDSPLNAQRDIIDPMDRYFRSLLVKNTLI